VTTARKQAGNLPLYYTEYNDGLYSDPPYHDTSYASAFIVKNINDLQGLVQLFSWWTFSDIFEEQVRKTNQITQNQF
jgi:xylan 1,4-beta-xylosidase